MNSMCDHGRDPAKCHLPSHGEGERACPPPVSRNPNDPIIESACREAVAAMRLGRRIDRTVPISAVSFSLQLAAEEWEKAEASA